MYSLMANCFAWLKRRKDPARAITLVVIGLDDAGKTTMVASLQGEPPDGITPTIGFANAELSISNFKVTVYDLGGGVRIRDVWRKYYSEVFGVVFVVDSYNGQRLGESKDVLHEVVKHEKIIGKPILVFANKKDKEGALMQNEVSNALELDDLSSTHDFAFKVVSCSALKGYGRNMDKNINTGFQWLLSTISAEFSKISARVENDVKVQKEEDERERKARIERIRKIREERDRLEREAGNDPDKEDSDDDVEMANPFQPIGKHLENVKAKEKKSKVEKEKAKTAKAQASEDQSKVEVPPQNGHIVKKKKKKKKKKEVIRTLENDIESQDIQPEAASTSHDALELGQQLAVKNEEDSVIVRKKKKKKKKVKMKKVNEDIPDDIIDGEPIVRTEEFENHVAPARKKIKKKKKKFTNLNEDNVMEHDQVVENHELEDFNKKPEFNENETVKKHTTKKRKKKKNRTVPVNNIEEVHEDVLPPPAWKTPPKVWASLPPIGNDDDNNHFGTLPPIQNHNTKRLMMESSLDKVSTPPSWTRIRPNSEDQDIVT